MADTEEILQFMSSLNLIRLNKPMGDWYSIYCPIHGDGQERRASCGVSMREQIRNGQTYPKNLCHCFACGLSKPLKDLVPELIERHPISTKDREKLEELLESDINADFNNLIPKETMQVLNAQYAANYVKSLLNPLTNYVSEEELAQYRYTVPYLYERKLTDEVIEKFDVGVDLHYVPKDRVREVPCVTFPVRDRKGNVLFVYRRALKTKNFFMPAELEKPVYGLYELPKDAKVVVLCESIFNCLTCYVYGIPALALFGTGTPAQIRTLQQLGVKEYVLGLDPDESGLKGCKRLKNGLKSVAIIRKMEIPEGKDINDLDRDEFMKVFEERV